MDIEKKLQISIDLYLNNFGILFLTCFIASIISAVSFGIFAGPLFGGLLMLALKLIRNRPAEFKEIFSHFNKFFPTLIISLPSSVILMVVPKIPVIGVFLGIVLSPVILVLMSFAFILIIDKDYPPLQALKEIIAFFKTDPLLIWIYALITLILSVIGAVAFGIGFFLTIPFSVVCMAVAYQEYFDKEYFKISGSNVH